MIDKTAAHGSNGVGFLLSWAALLLAVSGLLLYTLVIDEPYLGFDTDAAVETTLAVGIPALSGLAIATLALRRLRRR
ncbi:hypothetical protein [Actinoplanes sp. NPDC051851]|uniref:hypothetical protein n=1 Tax=Actinoplanes sp. NPDC051851 TaxID=3154753 RepID=UPI0034135A40